MVRIQPDFFRISPIGLVTLTQVDVSPDLKNGRIFFVVTGSTEVKPVLASLEKAAPFLQGALGRKLKLRYTPKLTFKFDETFEQAVKQRIGIGKPGSGYILSSACSVAPHVKPERLKKLAELATQLGQYD